MTAKTTLCWTSVAMVLVACDAPVSSPDMSPLTFQGNNAGYSRCYDKDYPPVTGDKYSKVPDCWVFAINPVQPAAIVRHRADATTSGQLGGHTGPGTPGPSNPPNGPTSASAGSGGAAASGGGTSAAAGGGGAAASGGGTSAAAGGGAAAASGGGSSAAAGGGAASASSGTGSSGGGSSAAGGGAAAASG